MEQFHQAMFLRKLETAIRRAITANRLPEKQPSRYWPIVFGALIGLIPSTILTGTQASFQRHQALFDRRLSVVAELSTAVHVEGSALLSRTADLELQLNQYPDTLTLDQDTDLSGKFRDLNRSILAWTARIAVQVNVMNAVFSNAMFADRSKILDFIPTPDAFRMELGPRQFSEPNWKPATIDSVTRARKNILKSMANMQNVLIDMSTALDR
jgi:hypothetical protein